MKAGTSQHRGTPKDGVHPRTNTRPRKADILAGASGLLAELLGRHSHWDDGKAQDSANDTEGVAVEGKEKTHGKEKGTEEDGVAVRDTKENAPEQESVIYLRGNREETVGIAPSPQQSERELKLHIQEEHRGEHQGARS